MTGIDSSKAFIQKNIVRLRFFDLLGKFSRKRIVILRYHSIEENPDDVDDSIGSSITHATADFRAHMRLISEKYDPVTMDDVVAYLNNDRDLSGRPVVVTFDDGYKNNIEIAAPILARYSIPALFFISVQSVMDGSPPFFARVRYAVWHTKNRKWYEAVEGETLRMDTREERLKTLRLINNRCLKLSAKERDAYVSEIEQKLEVQREGMNNLMMTWDELRQLEKQGHIIGSHGLTHPNLVYSSPDIRKKEIYDSKQILEEQLEKPVVHFSYPNPGLSPQWNNELNSMLREAGYRSATNSTFGSVTKSSDPFILRRMAVPDDAAAFLWYLGNTFIGRNL
jgi:peptidoglycan/xylan/chitin deacetylase (PgdA/CDA1 family)